jgi:hypothetical protein
MNDHMIREDQLPGQLSADQDEAGTPYLIGLADGALRLARRRRRRRAGLAGVAVLAAAAAGVGVTSGGWFDGAHTATVGPAAPGPRVIAHAQPLSLIPVISSEPGACPPGGGSPSSAPETCFQLDADAGLTPTDPIAVAAVDPATGQWMVALTLHGKDVPALTSLTSATAGRELAVVFDGRVLSDPTVATSINDGHFDIFGNYTRQAATSLADRLSGR